MDPGFLAVECGITVSYLAVCTEFHVAGRSVVNASTTTCCLNGSLITVLVKA